MRPAPRFFEDFTIDLRFRSHGEIVVSEDRIKSFAAEFDPQPFHLDAAAGAETFFGGLVASGWHTAAVAMRLLVDSDLGLGRGAGLAVESMRFPAPVRPGDALRLEGTVAETRASRAHADRGIVKFRIAVANQRDEVVLEATHVVMALRRTVPADR